ncbi:L-2-hydroxyglutarate oxidase [Rubripirellula obstinata]|nr:L-2-hydroxyglutarate oxidase [Rubripirellula obstinata]
MSIQSEQSVKAELGVVDIGVIGGGIVGLATARTLQDRFPDAQIALLEAEKEVARHQSGHNSGVLHSGIYYKPGSQKAALCRRGKTLMETFCQQHQIPWDRCGKVIVATTPGELDQLDKIAQRGRENGVSFEQIDSVALRELEPSAAGISALHVPETGIVNYAQVCRHLAELIKADGTTVRMQFEVSEITRTGNTLRLVSNKGDSIQCRHLINCGGLHSDRIYRQCIADASGEANSIRIVPFRGEYYELTDQAKGLCRNLIYPVPDPSFPFLGVHFTRMIDGGVECGPNAVFALSRSGYRWTDINLRDTLESLSYPGFQSLAKKHWRKGLGEIHRSLSKRAFVKALQKLIPEIRGRDLKPGRAGVRAQAIDADGNLIDDFLFKQTPGAIHVLSAPSPAATASLAIAETIVDRFAEQEGW